MASKPVNIVTFGKKRQNLLTALEKNTIGSYLGTFNEHISGNSVILLHCVSAIWGTAKISSEYFYSEDVLWKDKLYPHRFKISDVKLFKPLVLTNGKYNTMLRKEYGTGWAYKFLFSPQPLPDFFSKDILSDISNLDEINFQDMSSLLLDYEPK